MPLEPGHLRVVRTFTGRSDTSIRITSKWAVHTGAWPLALERRLRLPLVLDAAPCRAESLLLPLPSLGPPLGNLFLSSRVTFARSRVISALFACLSAGLEKQL